MTEQQIAAISDALERLNYTAEASDPLMTAAVDALCSLMADAGIAVLVVAYRGSGDEGYVKETIAYAGPGKEGPGVVMPDALPELAERLVYATLPGDWEMYAGGQGSMTVDPAASPRVTFAHEDNVITTKKSEFAID